MSHLTATGCKGSTADQGLPVDPRIRTLPNLDFSLPLSLCLLPCACLLGGVVAALKQQQPQQRVVQTKSGDRQSTKGADGRTAAESRRAQVGRPVVWRGKGLEEEGIDEKTGQAGPASRQSELHK